MEIQEEDLRIELKCVFNVDETDKELERGIDVIRGEFSASYEASSRFEERMDDVIPNQDLFLIVSWHLVEDEADGMAKIKIGNYLLKPAVDVAISRDTRQLSIDGKFDNSGTPLVQARDGSGYNRDTNFGKLDRLGDPGVKQFIEDPSRSRFS